jgi:hypothetical protein
VKKTILFSSMGIYNLHLKKIPEEGGEKDVYSAER